MDKNQVNIKYTTNIEKQTPITETTQKKDKSCDLSFLVAGAGLEPTTSGL